MLNIYIYVQIYICISLYASNMFCLLLVIHIYICIHIYMCDILFFIFCCSCVVFLRTVVEWIVHAGFAYMLCTSTMVHVRIFCSYMLPLCHVEASTSSVFLFYCCCLYVSDSIHVCIFDKRGFFKHMRTSCAPMCRQENCRHEPVVDLRLRLRQGFAISDNP